jgi:DNA-binding GntR family transcriptional regulator
MSAKKRSALDAVIEPKSQRSALGNSSKGLSLTEQAHQAIRLAIRQRRFRSGDRLIENELSDMLDLNRAKENVVDHARILTALMSQDPIGAECAAREHIQKAYSARVKRMFKKE